MIEEITIDLKELLGVRRRASQIVMFLLYGSALTSFYRMLFFCVVLVVTVTAKVNCFGFLINFSGFHLPQLSPRVGCAAPVFINAPLLRRGG